MDEHVEKNGQKSDAEKAAEQIVNCLECGKKMADMEDMTSLVEDRPVEDSPSPSAVERGIVCPHCESWTHVCYMNQRLTGLQKGMKKAAQRFVETRLPRFEQEYKRLRRTYRRQFDTYNRHMREKHGGRSPAERIAAGEGHERQESDG